jgi:hypothetical protein
MRRTALLALGLAMASPSPALASDKVETGDYSRARSDVLKALAAPPLATIGADVVRFSTAPALGGQATVVELHRVDATHAEGRAWFLAGHPHLGWTRQGELRLHLTVAAFDALTGGVDAALDKAAAAAPPDRNDLVICTDGPGYLSERRVNGQARWLSGFCGDHPNDRIAALIGEVLARNVRGYLGNLGPALAGTKQAQSE